MVTYEELVEKVARDIHQNAFRQYDSLYQYCLNSGDTEIIAKSCADTMHRAECDEARTKAKAAIATICEALSEPSEAMRAAAQSEWPDTARMLKAALAASPLVEDERKAVSNENSGENDRCPY